MTRWAGLFSALLALPVIADDVAELWWDPPRTRENGQPFDPATEVKEYRLYCSGKQVTTIPPLSGGRHSASKSEMFGDEYGIHECAMTVVDTGGLESKFSNTVNIPYLAINVSQPPQSQTVAEGEQATFSVTAEGNGLSYQWRKNGEPIEGATERTLVLESVSSEDAGQYNVLITDAAGQKKWTAIATLEVQAVQAAPEAPTNVIYIYE